MFWVSIPCFLVGNNSPIKNTGNGENQKIDNNKKEKEQTLDAKEKRDKKRKKKKKTKRE